MTIWYLNSIAGSTANGGTAENDALVSFSGVISAGVTGGDIIYVKGGGATYDGLPTTDFVEEVSIEGYDTTVGDECLNGTPPMVANLNTGRFLNASNLSYTADLSSSAGFLIMDLRDRNIKKNITIHHTASYSTGNNYALMAGGDGAFVYGLRYYAAIGVKHNTTIAFNNATAAHRTPLIGCVFDLTNFQFSGSSGVGRIWSADLTGYGSGTCLSTVFMGNPEEDHTAFYYNWQNTTGRQTIRNCIFYNCGTGIEIVTSAADKAALLAGYSQPVQIENCFFVNCGTGIKLQSGFDFPFVVKDCVFYNCTSANIDGSVNIINSINATQNPFDATNRRLNDYGKSLLTGRFLTGFDTVTTDSSRRFYELPVGTEFSETISGSLSLGTGDVGDTVTVSGKSFQKISNSPIVWNVI
jgi:hypothetical protein